MKTLDFELKKLSLPKWEDLPNIDLYMDQIITYLDDVLSNIIKNEKSEKIITKTMINNYVKQEIIPPPEKKKYSKIHIAELIVICILKEVYSIPNIKNLISLALSTSEADICYNRFCNYYQNCLTSTFNGTAYSSDEKLTSEQYLLKNVVQSYVNKLYVQITYLHML